MADSLPVLPTTPAKSEGSASATAHDLFMRHFWPLYPEPVRADLIAARKMDANPGKNPSFEQHMAEAASVFVGRSPVLFGDDLGLDYSDASVHRLSHALTRARRDAWASEGAAGTPENTLFNVVVHGAAYVGTCIAKKYGGEWAIRSPLWESLMELESPLGRSQLAIFHWWLKALADEAVDGETGSLADRYRAHVEVPRSPIPTRVPFVDPTRSLPRLSKIRYDVFYKYLKANLPEIRDVGRDFPSAERFGELRFRWLDFRVLGDGRMVLVAGPGANGAFLFWLGEGGFEKSAFFECDPTTDPDIRVNANTLSVAVTKDGQRIEHEMLWWGP